VQHKSTSSFASEENKRISYFYLIFMQRDGEFFVKSFILGILWID